MAVRGVSRLLILATWAALLSSPSTPAVARDASWRQAVARLAQEKALAEGCASILKTFADDAPMARVQGQRLYARAKADVDGLVALLLVDLAEDRSPAAIPELRQRLEMLPKQRQVMCEHVDAAVGTSLRDQGAHAVLVDRLVEGASDTTGPMIEAAIEFWQAYRRADQARRQTMAAALDATRWRDYAEVPQAGAG